MKSQFLIFTATCGEFPAESLEEARAIAARLAAPAFDKPRIFKFLPACGCECGGQIHPQSEEIL